MVKWLYGFLAVFLFLFFGFSSVSAYQVPSQPTGYINDYAEIISEEKQIQLEDQLTDVANATGGAEIAVVTVESLDGEPIEDVGQQFFDSWGIGKKDLDNGVLLIVSTTDRELMIITGYGTEALITDAMAGRIIRNDITPSFKEGNYEQGIENGLTAITFYLSNPDDIPADTNTSQNNVALQVFIMLWLFFGIGLVSYVAAFLGRTKSWWLGGLIGGVLGFLMGSITGGLILGVFGFILDYILSKNYKQWKLDKKATDWSKTLGGFKSSGPTKWGGGSSGGFGGFSGGSSGGGGARGSW